MNPNMKVLVLFSAESNGIHTLFCKNLLQGFIRSSINYRFVYASGRNKGDEKNPTFHNANRIHTKISTFFGRTIPRRDLIDRINSFSPTYLHLINPHMAGLSATLSARFQLKTVLTYIGGRLPKPHIYGNASKIITFYELHRETLVNRYNIPREKVQIIPMGLDFESTTKSAYRRNKKIIIGTNANLLRKREAEVFLNLVISLSKERGNIEFLVSCEEDKEYAFRKLSKELGIESAIVFMTTPEEPSYFLNVIDIYVVPSESSGVLSSVIQAQASGVPVVCLSSKSLPLYEEVQEEKTGNIIEGLDFFQFKKKIIPLVDSAEKLKNFKEKALEFSSNRHGLDKMMLQLKSIYSEI